MNRLPALLVLLVLTNGCATFVARSGAWADRASMPKYYPATLIDAGMISQGYAEPDLAGWGCLGMLDLPFSLITDTVCLPVDAAR